jgi:copper transport protein
VLEDSSPRAGQVLASAQAVRDVELRFDEAVGVGLGSVGVIGADGQRVDAGVVYRPGSDRKRVAVRLRDGLANGSYLVLWRVVSADSHPVSGSFSFAVGLPGPVATGVTESGGLTVPVTLGVARFAGLAGVLLLTGAIVFCACFAQVVMSRTAASTSAMVSRLAARNARNAAAKSASRLSRRIGMALSLAQSLALIWP